MKALCGLEVQLKAHGKVIPTIVTVLDIGNAKLKLFDSEFLLMEENLIIKTHLTRGHFPSNLILPSP